MRLRYTFVAGGPDDFAGTNTIPGGQDFPLDEGTSPSARRRWAGTSALAVALASVLDASPLFTDVTLTQDILYPVPFGMATVPQPVLF